MAEMRAVIFIIPMLPGWRVSAILTALLAAACYVFAYKGLTALKGITDPAQFRDAKGFAWFVFFLGSVFLGIAVLSWKSVGDEEA